MNRRSAFDFVEAPNHQAHSGIDIGGNGERSVAVMMGQIPTNSRGYVKKVAIICHPSTKDRATPCTRSKWFSATGALLFAWVRSLSGLSTGASSRETFDTVWPRTTFGYA